MTLETINPTNGQIIKIYETMPLSGINQIIDATYQTFLQWRETDLTARAGKLRVAGEILLKNKQDYAALITEEMGKPLKAATSEIEKCARLCQHFADQSSEYLKPHVIQTEMKKSYVTYQPLGIVFGIMPWNFPFWQVFRFAGPAIMAGNAGLLKHAPTTTGCGLAIEKIFLEAGFPANLFSAVIIDNEQAKSIIEHPKIAGITLTGSVNAGKKVGAEAAHCIKKVVLELGGSDPYHILEDEDKELAAEQCVQSRLSNAGQTCIAAKRLIVVETVQQAFEQKVIEKAKLYKVGNPTDSAINIGPLARADLRDTVQRQVEESIAKGAQLVLGGKSLEGPGFFYPVTLLKNVTPGMPAYEQEIFGPVIVLITAKDEQDAIRIANQSNYGLGAAVFTKDVARGEKIAQQLEAGTCCVNTLVASDPRLPFGGIKCSGFGRELGAQGIHEFTNIKTICVN